MCVKYKNQERSSTRENLKKNSSLHKLSDYPFTSSTSKEENFPERNMLKIL